MAAPLEQLRLHAATREDASRIAEIHMAAFGPNAMLHAQFPTPIIRQELQKCIEKKALADIDDSKTTVLVVTGSKDKENKDDLIIAFAKWSHPVLPSEDYKEPAWVWPEGTHLNILEAWTAKAAEVESRVIGDAPCYRLTFIGTDPAYGHQGAGQLLLKWGIEQCHGSGSPLYLESTMEAAPFYQKNGFTAKETISLPISVDGGVGTEIYEEIAFTYWACVKNKGEDAS